jgi:hypothetical protein
MSMRNLLLLFIIFSFIVPVHSYPDDIIKRGRWLGEILMWILIGWFVLIFFVLVFRIFAHYIKRKRIEKTTEKALEKDKDILNLLKPLLIDSNYPTLFCFNINQTAFDTIINHYDLSFPILEEKKLFNYIYYLVYSPCVFILKSKTPLALENKVMVKATRKLVLSISNLSGKTPPLF